MCLSKDKQLTLNLLIKDVESEPSEAMTEYKKLRRKHVSPGSFTPRISKLSSNNFAESGEMLRKRRIQLDCANISNRYPR